MKELFHSFLYQPIYNALVFLVDILPGGDVGLAIIILTLLVKFALFPLTHKSTKAQHKMREIEPKMREIKERHKDNREKQARAIMDLYREHGVNPFSGLFLLFIQLPIIFALYYVFWKGLGFDPNIIYSFLSAPDPASVNFNFLGFIDLKEKSAILAFLAAATQYFQIKLSLPALPKKDSAQENQDRKKKENQEKKTPPSFQEEFAKNMSTQMRYIFPAMVFFISFTISSAIALYWAVSNIFTIAHEMWVKRKAGKIYHAQ